MAYDYSAYFNEPGGGLSPYDSPFLAPRATSGSNSVPYVDYRQESPGQANRENRANFANWGLGMDEDLDAERRRQLELENYYRNPMNRAYGDLMNNPGFTPEEFNNITRYEQYNSGRMTPEEMETIRGNPSSYGQYFDPSTLRGIEAFGQAQQRNALTEGKVGLTNATGDLIRDYGNAISPDLAASGDYMNSMRGAVSSGERNVRSALDRDRLTLDPTLRNDYLMTDRELQGIQDKAMNSTRLSREAGYSDIYRRALASGNADPMALAALRQDYQREADRAAGDASLSAYLAGRNEQANRRMNLEQARLGAEQGYSGLATSNEQQLADRGLNAAQSMENTRLGASQDISNRRIQTSGDLANKRFDAAQWGANAGMGLEGDIANRYGNTERYITDTGFGINRAADEAASNRGLNLANTRFGQNTDIEDRQSAAWQNAANNRRADQGDFRNWASGQTNATADRAGAYAGQRINAGNATMGNVNQATGQWGDYDMGRRNSGFGAAFKNSLGSALGKTIGSPQFSF